MKSKYILGLAILILIFLISYIVITKKYQTGSRNSNTEEQRSLTTEYDELSDKYDLKYSTLDEAVAALEASTQANNLTPKIVFYVPGKVPREDGNPYFTFFKAIDRDKNVCRTGYMNLVTGETESHNDACVIY